MISCITGPHIISVRRIMADLSLDEIIATKKGGLNFKVQFSYVYSSQFDKRLRYFFLILGIVSVTVDG